MEQNVIHGKSRYTEINNSNDPGFYATKRTRVLVMDRVNFSL